MKIQILVVSMLFCSYLNGQNQDIQNQLQEISNQFKTQEKTEDGVYTETINFSLNLDTIHIFHSKGFPESFSMDEYHYYLKVNFMEDIEYKELNLMGITNSTISFSSKENKNNLIFFYGTAEEAMNAIKEGSLSEDELQNNITISLPSIENRELYKKLEVILKSLMK